MNCQQTLCTLYTWLGDRAVLLPLPLGKKGPEGTDWLDWQTTTFEGTQQPEYQKALFNALKRGGNIGVLLVDQLAAIDIDDDQLARDFIELNPTLRDSLISKGFRGCQIWVRIIGDYPKRIYKIKTKDGEKWGEWRGGGGQSVILGQHPEHTPEKPVRYQRIVANPTLEIAFADIVWPANLRLGWQKQCAQEATPAQSNPLNLDRRISAYIAAIPGAISGNDGHGQTYSVARSLVNGWNLTATQAMPYMQAYNQRCEPPWTEKELAHKLLDAEKEQEDRPKGYLIGKDCSVDLTGTNDNDCPYPPVDWSLAKQGDNVRFNHPAIYPKDSILDPFMNIGRTICEGADCYLIGSILPVIAAMLGRSIYLQWGAGKIYPNVFNLLVGKAGDRKSSTIQISTRIALECLPTNAFLPHLFSPESMFDEYFERPDKIWLVDDANPILNDWKLSSNGERVAARFLPLYDCGRLTESFRKNKSETSAGRREVPETSTSVLFGATFNVAGFQGQQIRAGLARRFLDYIADAHGRLIVRPDKVDLSGLIDLFKPILRLKGEVDFSQEAFTVWDQYQRDNRNQLDAADILDEPLCSRLSSAPTHVQKIAMLFEACRCAYRGATITEIRADTLELAVQHVEENMKSAAFLESIAERAAIAKSAELVLATVRNKFPVSRPRTIYATRSGLTYELCKHGGRQGALTTDDLYNQVIPYLETQNLAQTVLKKGNLTVFAFQTEQE
jgi:hypothetical protein